MVSWEDIERVFDETLSHPLDEQDQFLSQRCAGKPGLFQEVSSLLHHHRRCQEDGFAETPSDLDRAFIETKREVAGYQLMRVLGRGGMGVVYEVRCSRSGRTYALKLLRKELADPSMERRFRQEAEVLSRLRHPGVARIVEAGCDKGQRFLVMERIDGVPLLEYANGQQLDFRDRLRLFLRVCDAVQHAHDAKFIHRDLKPSNVLVDETGQPKLVDFGIARPASGDSSTTPLTHAGQLVGTPLYMSPEQVQGVTPLRPCSDVYSMAVILFELLAGESPYGTVGPSTYAALHAVQTFTPPALSTLSQNSSRSLDEAIQSALEKDPAHRPSSVAEFRERLTQALGETSVAAIEVRRSSRMWVAGIAVVATICCAGTLVFQPLHGLKSPPVFASHSESSSPDPLRPTVTGERSLASPPIDRVGNILLLRGQRALARFQQGGKEPALDELGGILTELRARKADPTSESLGLERQYARILLDTGQFSKAARVASSALPRHEARFGDTAPETLECQDLAAIGLQESGRYFESRDLFQTAWERSRKTFGETSEDTLERQHHWGTSLLSCGEFQKARSALDGLVEKRVAFHGEDSRKVLESKVSLARALVNLEELSAAERLMDQVEQTLHRSSMDPTPFRTNILLLRCRLLMARGRLEEARVEFDTAVALIRARRTSEHPTVLASMGNLGLLLHHQGKIEAAEEIQRVALDTMSQVLGTEHPFTLTAQHNLAAVLAQTARLDESMPLFSKTLATRKRVLGPSHRNTCLTRILLMDLHWQRKQYPEAFALFEEQRRQFPTPDATTMGFSSPYQMTRFLGETESHFQQTFERASSRNGLCSQASLQAALFVARSLRASRPREALDFVDEVLSTCEWDVREGNEALAMLRLLYGCALADNGDTEGARDHLLEGLESSSAESGLALEAQDLLDSWDRSTAETQHSRQPRPAE